MIIFQVFRLQISGVYDLLLGVYDPLLGLMLTLFRFL